MIPVIWASPNLDGLTAACARAAEAGIKAAGKECECIQLNGLDIRPCSVCGKGWGSCYYQHECVFQDDFAGLKNKLMESEALVLVTPVYYGEESEVLKNFLDKVRRCHTELPVKPYANHQIIIIAAAGGSGNGTVSCLEEMERFAKHMTMKLWDAVMVTRYNRDYKIEQIETSAKAMATYLK